jgi:hypothetical protein
MDAPGKAELFRTSGRQAAIEANQTISVKERVFEAHPGGKRRLELLKQSSLAVDDAADDLINVAFVGGFAVFENLTLLVVGKIAPELEKLGRLVDGIDRLIVGHRENPSASTSATYSPIIL